MTGADPRVLIVEDDGAVGGATGMVLESCGFDVRNVVDGPAALELIGAGYRPDLIVADYRLPGDNGLEVVQAIRRAVAAEIPAIIVTGDTSAGELLDRQSTNVQMLRKPMDAEVFMELIERYTRN